MAEVSSRHRSGQSFAPTEQDIARFLASAPRPGHATWMVRRLLRPFMSDFALNGVFGTYPLYLMDTPHWEGLLGGRPGGRLLDVGAAAGEVTATMAPLYDEVVATDTSAPMVRRLRDRGFLAFRHDLAERDLVGPSFDTVALLNVLDRCSDPHALLAAAVRHTRPGGSVVVSMPLPYDPWWYAGSLPRRPRKPLPLRGQLYEADFGSLVDVVLPLAGIEPVRWIETPYVSAGDRRRPDYRLDAAVIVGRVAG